MTIDNPIVPFMLVATITAVAFIFFMISILIVTMKRQNRREKEFLRLLIKDRERRNQRMNLELNQNIINPMSASRFSLNEIKDNKKNEDQESVREALAHLTLALDHIYHLDQYLNDYNIEKYGLYFAVSEELNWIHKTTSIKCDLQIEEGTFNFPIFESLLLLRIIQEALSNSLDHAHTKKINVVFQFKDDTLNLCIEDFGIGFPITLLATPVGEGIKNMKYFAKQLKGDLEIESNPGHGTKIQLHIPYLSRFFSVRPKN